ncbi:MAG: DinB family protein, partial [Bacteroidota bacterium]
MQTKVLSFSDKKELIRALEESAQETLPYFDLPQHLLQRSYQKGKWTVRQVLHHLTDAETVLYERIRRVICVPDQVIWAFDQEAWAVELNYHQFPMSINKNIFQAVRQAVIYLADEFYESKGE